MENKTFEMVNAWIPVFAGMAGRTGLETKTPAVPGLFLRRNLIVTQRALAIEIRW